MFYDNDLLFLDPLDDNTYLQGHGAQRNSLFNPDILKFDIADSSLAVPVNCEDSLGGHSGRLFPQPSSSHIDAVIDNVVQNDNWISYENNNNNNSFLVQNAESHANQSANFHRSNGFNSHNDERFVYNNYRDGFSNNREKMYLQAEENYVQHLGIKRNAHISSLTNHSTTRLLNYSDHHSGHQSSKEDENISVTYYDGDGYRCEPSTADAARSVAFLDEYYSTDELDAIINGGANVNSELSRSESAQEFFYDSSNVTANMTNVLRQGRKGPTTKICEFCGLFLRHPSKIAAHMRTHTGERPFTCEYCGQDFSQRTPYRMHVKRHVGDLPFFCSFCHKKFPSNASRNGHEIRVHHKLRRQGAPQPHLKPPNVALVERAGLAELARSDIQTTRSTILDWDQQYGNLCEPTSNTALRRITGIVDAVASGIPHHRLNTAEGRPARFEDRHPPTVAQCTDCGLIFKHPSKIQAHMRTHTGEKPFVCKECGLGCSTNSALRVHVRRFHTGERPHECTWDCGKRFVSVAARNEHERIVHAGVKRYQCTVGNCRRLFTRRSYMVKHLQSHAAESNSPQHESYLRLSVPSTSQLRTGDSRKRVVVSQRVQLNGSGSNIGILDASSKNTNHGCFGVINGSVIMANERFRRGCHDLKRRNDASYFSTSAFGYVDDDAEEENFYDNTLLEQQQGQRYQMQEIERDEQIHLRQQVRFVEEDLERDEQNGRDYLKRKLEDECHFTGYETADSMMDQPARV